jgi:hypothetical protein
MDCKRGDNDSDPPKSGAMLPASTCVSILEMLKLNHLVAGVGEAVIALGCPKATTIRYCASRGINCPPVSTDAV